MISVIIAIASFGLMMIYFILFAEIGVSLSRQMFFDGKETSNFFGSKTFYVLLLAAAMLPLVVKKELKELKVASVILFVGILSFIFIFIGQLIWEEANENIDDDYGQYYKLDFELESVKGISIIIVAFSFQQNLFPMFNSLK